MTKWFAVPALVVLCGCDPEIELSGTVYANDGGVAAGAKVELACTGTTKFTMPTSTQTDRSGRFSLKGTGCLPSTCVVSSGAGFRKVEQPLMEWCTKSAPSCPAGSCVTAAGNLTLP